MGSPLFAVPSLECLQDSSHEVAAVITQPDRPGGRRLKVQPPPAKIAAERLGLSVLQPGTTRKPEFLEVLASFRPEAIVVVAFGEILKRPVLELPPRGAINLHASLLPGYRGAAPIPWTILQGETETGVTTIQMNESMDAGPILLQERCMIGADDTSATLGEKLAQSGALLLRKTLDLIQAGQIRPVEQDASSVTFAPKLKKEDGRVNWTDSAERIARQIRAFDPWPGTFSRCNDTVVKFWKAHAVAETHTAAPGTILSILRNSFHIACGNGVLEVIQLQPENRSRMRADEFIHGYRIDVGGCFR